MQRSMLLLRIRIMEKYTAALFDVALKIACHIELPRVPVALDNQVRVADISFH